jgi:pimeloyl-ACP methyl ester carboxylesterase
VSASQVAWVDPSPHAQHLVRVPTDGAVEVLDWGGNGPAVVLLAQMGQTAHIYDGWAPTLTPRHHVLGITRRGHGSSSAREPYTTETLATDVLHVLDAQGLEAAVIAGNGFAGEEMSWLASRFPHRILGLVYLDAAYDRTGIASEAAITSRIPRRGPTPQDTVSTQALAAWARRVIGVPIPESEYRQLAVLAPDGRVTGQRTPPSVQQAMLAGISRTDWATIRTPILAIYVKGLSGQSYPGCGTMDAAVSQVCDELHARSERQRRNSQRLLASRDAPTRILELEGAHPFVFLSNPTDVRQAIDEFVARLPDPAVKDAR